MTALSSLCMVLFQSTDAPPPSSERHLLVLFIGVVALSLFVNAIVTSIAGMKIIGMIAELKTVVADLHGKVNPILDKTTTVIDELAPKVRTITTNVEEVTYTVREQCTELSATLADLNRTVRDANARTRAQVSRVDGLVSDALTTTEHVSKTVQEGIKTPVRHIAGVVAGAKAAVETLMARSPFPLRKQRDMGDTEF